MTDQNLEEGRIPLYEVTPPVIEEEPPAQYTETAEAEISADASAESNVTAEAPPPAPPRDRKKLFRVAAIAVAAVLVLGVAAAFAVPAIIKAVNPKVYIASCFAETMAELGDPEAAAVLAATVKKPFRLETNMRLGIGAANPLNEKYGLDATPQAAYTGIWEYDRAQRRADFDLSIDLRGQHLASLLFQLNDAVFSFGSPELTDDTYYCLNTETLGVDMAASPVFGGTVEADPELGFNFFDAPAEGALSALNSDTTALLAQFAKALERAVTVEKAVSVGGYWKDKAVTGNDYQMTVPAAALREYLNSATLALFEDEGFKSAGFEGFLSLYIGGDVTEQELLDSFKQFLESFQDDIVITFSITGGHVTGLRTCIRLQGSAVEELELICGTDGVTTSVDYRYRRGSDAPFHALFTCEQDGEAFHCSLRNADSDSNVLTADGTLAADKAAGTLTLDCAQISLTSGDTTENFALRYALSPLDAFTHEPLSSPTPILEMDQEALFGVFINVLYSADTILKGDVGYSVQ